MRRALLAWLLAAACQKGGEPPAEGPKPMPAGEEQRAMDLCTAYVERICACAERDASLREACELSRGQPEAVRMHLDVLHGAPLAPVGPSGELRDGGAAERRGPLNDRERQLTEASLRKVVAACVKLDSELPPSRCPRPGKN